VRCGECAQLCAARTARSAKASRSFQRLFALLAATTALTFGYDPSPMIAIMWQFDVKKGREKDFENLYGVDGDWTALNRQTRSYLGSSFLRDQNQSSRYLVIEYWSEMLVYEQHRASRSAMIDSIEARRAELIEVVEPLGIYSALDVPDRWGPAWSQKRR